LASIFPSAFPENCWFFCVNGSAGPLLSWKIISPAAGAVPETLSSRAEEAWVVF